jgi:hypothetical protein
MPMVARFVEWISGNPEVTPLGLVLRNALVATERSRVLIGQKRASRRSGALRVRYSPQTKTMSASREICPKRSRSPLALTFPDTSLFLKVVKRLERKIDEKAALFNESPSSKSMTFNEMKVEASFAEYGVPPTMEGFLVVEEGLTISHNLLKTWWPGTELNRRRQPFQCYVMLCFKQLK